MGRGELEKVEMSQRFLSEKSTFDFTLEIEPKSVHLEMRVN